MDTQAIERFEITCRKTRTRLDQVKNKFNRIEPLSSQQEIEEIRGLHQKVVADIDDDFKCSKEIAETLESIVKKPFSIKETGPLTKFNYDYLEKWVSSLDTMREELQILWGKHEKYLNDSLVLCRFEKEYCEVSTVRYLFKFFSVLAICRNRGCCWLENSQILLVTTGFISSLSHPL